MLFELKGVSYIYGAGTRPAAEALCQVDLGVRRGEFVGVIGPTGSGKSTLLQIVGGLLRPSAGRVFFGGRDIWAAAGPDWRRHVGLVFGEPERQLFEATVEDDVAFWPRQLGVGETDIRELVGRALEAVGLDPTDYRGRSPFALSGGEMRRVAMAGVLVTQPELLVLDEPTTGLDFQGKTDIRRRVKAMHDDGATVVLISHDMDEIAALADRLIVLDAGRVAYDGPPRPAFADCAYLERLGLGWPDSVELARRLSAKGRPLAGVPLALDEARDLVLAAMRGGRA